MHCRSLEGFSDKVMGRSGGQPASLVCNTVYEHRFTQFS